jgi:hypothetical protein
MKRNNFWNRVFHKSEVAKNRADLAKYSEFLKHVSEYFDALEDAHDLQTLFALHKDICPNLTRSEVILGNIYGLNTRTMDDWEKYKEDKYGVNAFGINADTLIYTLIVSQYKERVKVVIMTINNFANLTVKKLHSLGY